jgi:hypothetical protein
MAGLFGAAVAAAPAPAKSELLLRNLFPNAALSVDAMGNLTAGNKGQVQAEVPAGSTVVQAYLYASSVWDFHPVQRVTFAGTPLAPSAGTILSPDRNPATTVRWDVTNLVKNTIESGPGGIYNFSLVEDASFATRANDGEVLVVAYRNAATQGHTALVLDGELATRGDTQYVLFAQPYSGGDFIMSLASSFSLQPYAQYTQIDVGTSGNPASRRLTTCAGGEDDGQSINGALITAGGVGDSTGNPDPACSYDDGPRVDDELYNLAAGNSANSAPFISKGDTWLRLNTINESNDDNIFGLFISAGFEVTGVTDKEPPKPVSEPPAAALMAIALLGLTALRRRWLS